MFSKTLNYNWWTLNNSINNSCFSAIFDHFDPYEKYLHKKNLYKESIWIVVSRPCVDVPIKKMTIQPEITVQMINKIQEKLVYIELSM